jgi:hypothetical protein
MLLKGKKKNKKKPNYEKKPIIIFKKIFDSVWFHKSETKKTKPCRTEKIKKTKPN